MKKLIYLIIPILFILGCKKSDPDPIVQPPSTTDTTTTDTTITDTTINDTILDSVRVSSFTVYIDGVYKEYTGVTARIFNGKLILVGKDTTDTPNDVTTGLHLLNFDSIGLGTYPLSDTTLAINQITHSIKINGMENDYFSAWCINLDNGGGEVVITEIDAVNERVTGTFHTKVGDYTDGINGTAEYNLTQGTFEWVYYGN